MREYIYRVTSLWPHQAGWGMCLSLTCHHHASPHPLHPLAPIYPSLILSHAQGLSKNYNFYRFSHDWSGNHGYKQSWLRHKPEMTNAADQVNVTVYEATSSGFAVYTFIVSVCSEERVNAAWQQLFPRERKKRRKNNSWIFQKCKFEGDLWRRQRKCFCDCKPFRVVETHINSGDKFHVHHCPLREDNSWSCRELDVRHQLRHSVTWHEPTLWPASVILYSFFYN